MLPEPDCTHGYSVDLLEEYLSKEDFKDLMWWMRGQTMALCDGRRYDYEKREYYETGHSHGPVVYPWDVKRWERVGPILD